MNIRELPLFHFAGGPIGRRFDVWRVGQARAVDIAQVAHDVHHLRVVEAFIFNFVNRIQIGCARRLCGGRQHHGNHQQHCQCNSNSSHCCPLQLNLIGSKNSKTDSPFAFVRTARSGNAFPRAAHFCPARVYPTARGNLISKLERALLAFIHLYERTVSEAGTIADYNLFPAAMAA